MPQTMIELLRDRSERILETLDELLARSSLHSVDSGPPGPILLGPHYAWNELDPDGRRVQSRLLNELDRYEPLVEAFVRVAPEGVRERVQDATKTLREIADRTYLTWYATPQEARGAAGKAITAHLDALDALDDSSDGLPIYVPDANATIASPGLDEWTFSDSSSRPMPDGGRRRASRLRPGRGRISASLIYEKQADRPGAFRSPLRSRTTGRSLRA